jgi:hypothetical protein
LGFHYEDPIYKDDFERANAFDAFVKKYSVVAKALIAEGNEPEMNMCVFNDTLSAPSGLMSLMPEDQKIRHQALKYWSIDNLSPVTKALAPEALAA